MTQNEMSTILTPDNLKRGMDLFLDRKGWPEDFHASLYTHLAEIQNDRFSNEWWDEIVDLLWEWRAIRPRTKDFIHQRGKPQLAKMRKSLQNIKAQDIKTCEWDSVADLFNAAHEIKNVHSPVLASKLCHFILPAIFPIFDNEALDFPIPCYQYYWNYCRKQWLECDNKKQLKEILRPHLNQDGENYPWAVRIIELCIIGRDE